MRAYWAVGGRNFGDLLTPLLFDRLCGISLEWSEREDAELFAVGSLGEMIPRGYTGLVIGTGCMFGEPIELDGANVVALRGLLTARAAGLHPPLLADLGLLTFDLAPVVRRDVAIGTVRAGGDVRPPMGMALDPAGDPEQLIRAAASCQRIVSSSLHGLVLADALGIPSMWDPHPLNNEADGFKFRDYASAYGERIEPYQWRVADQVQVAEKQAALRSVLAGFRMAMAA